MSTPPLYTVTELPSSMGFPAWPAAINENTVVVGWLADPFGYGSAAIWDGGPSMVLQSVAGDSYAFSLNNAGQVVGATPFYTKPPHAFLYPDPKPGPQTEDLNAALGGKESSVAYDINAHGVIVGSTGDWFGLQKPFIYDPSSNLLIVLDPLAPKTSAYASAINDDGHVVGISGGHAFVYKNGKTHDQGIAWAINGLSKKGITTGARKVGGTLRAFRLDTSGVQPAYEQLGSSPVGIFNQNEGLGINDSAVVVGVSWAQKSPQDLYRAFVDFPPSSPNEGWWDLQDVVVNAPHWIFEYATGINNKGQIVGSGTNHGNPSVFLLTPVPVTPPGDVFNGKLIELVMMFGGAAEGGGGWGVLPNGKRVPIPPRQDFVAFWARLPRRTREAFVGRTIQALAALIDNPERRKSVEQAARDFINGIAAETKPKP